MRAAAGLALVLACASATAAPSEKPMLKVTGTIKDVRTEDVSKRAGVPNLYSYVTIAVERVEPAGEREKLRAEVEVVQSGKVEFAVGAKVQVEFQWDKLSASEGRFRAQSIKRSD